MEVDVALEREKKITFKNVIIYFMKIARIYHCRDCFLFRYYSLDIEDMKHGLIPTFHTPQNVKHLICMNRSASVG